MLTIPDGGSTLADRVFSAAAIDFSRLARVVVAVSGGGDSSALLYLLHDHWVGKLKRSPADLCAVTVNHRVRPEASDEANEVAAWCKGLGIVHHHVSWDGGSVKSGFQAAARMARYEKLSAVAETFGDAVVVTGHTWDDQIETLMMRSARREDGFGLAGIPPATLYDRKTWFARPLLNTRRENLRTVLRQRALQWFDDPSNLNEDYERVRVRNSALADGGHLWQRSRAAAKERLADAQKSALWIRHHARLSQNGEHSQHIYCSIDGTTLPEAAAAIGYLLMLVGGQQQRPKEDKVGRAIKSCLSKQGASFTLAGCLLARRDDRLEVTAEARNQGRGHFGLDRLLPFWEFEVLHAIDQLRGRPKVGSPLFCRFD
ncbi:MAG: tRNA lysidine(34) synthetase TilS [Pseudomonadota bacterium]